MSGLRDRCPGCSRRLIITRFDTTFRLPDRTERLCFGDPRRPVRGLPPAVHRSGADRAARPRRGPLRVRDRERRRPAGRGLVLRRLTPPTRARPGARRPPAGDDPLPHPQGERQPSLLVRPAGPRRPLDHRVELQHALEGGLELRAASSAVPVPTSFSTRNGCHVHRPHEAAGVAPARGDPATSISSRSRRWSWHEDHRLRRRLEQVVEQRAGGGGAALGDGVEARPGRVRDHLGDQRPDVVLGDRAVLAGRGPASPAPRRRARPAAGGPRRPRGRSRRRGGRAPSMRPGVRPRPRSVARPTIQAARLPCPRCRELARLAAGLDDRRPRGP